MLLLLSALAVIWPGEGAPPLGRQFCTALRVPPMQATPFLTGLGFYPLYHEAIATPFSQSHCKHGNNWEKPAMLEGRRRAQASRDCVSSCLGSVCWALPPACGLAAASWGRGTGTAVPICWVSGLCEAGHAPCSFVEMAAYG